MLGSSSSGPFSLHQAPPAQPHSLQQRDEGLVGLPPHLSQFQGHWDTPPPALGLVGARWGSQGAEKTPRGLGPEGKQYLEAELRELGSLGYRWQLQEVPTDNELDPSEWLILLPDSSAEERGVL